MNIKIYWSWELPKKLSGAVAVVDVYAASTNMASFLSRGVSRLLLVNDDTIQILKKQYPEALAIGESFKLPKSYFVSSNWPNMIAEVKVIGKTVLYMSNNGTRVIQEAMSKGSDPVFAVGFMNFRHTATWIRRKKIESLVILAAGEISFDDRRVAEDRVCAQLLQKLLLGKDIDYKTEIRDVKRFMREQYRGIKIPYNERFVFQENPVIPLCKQLHPGVIEVTDASSLDTLKAL
jgi:phosphosulfolactate phosphohydrolase-like enzyme